MEEPGSRIEKVVGTVKASRKEKGRMSRWGLKQGQVCFVNLDQVKGRGLPIKNNRYVSVYVTHWGQLAFLLILHKHLALMEQKRRI